MCVVLPVENFRNRPRGRAQLQGANEMLCLVVQSQYGLHDMLAMYCYGLMLIGPCDEVILTKLRSGVAQGARTSKASEAVSWAT